MRLWVAGGAVGGWLLLPALLCGCTVVAVTATAVSVTASAVGLAADAAVGTVKVVGKGVGMAANAVSGGDSSTHSASAPDHSGTQIHESIRPAAPAGN